MNIPAPFSQNQMRFFWNCFDHWFNVAEGGKRGGKNVLITMAYCTILEKHPSRIHLIAGVSTATARLNILDCDGFGLKNYFEGRCREGTYQNRDCLYIKTATGEKVVLVSGGGKAQPQGLGHGVCTGRPEVKEQQGRADEDALHQKGEGGRPTEGEQEQLIGDDPKVAEKDQKAQKAEKVRVPGGQVQKRCQSGQGQQPHGIEGSFHRGLLSEM